ncbi:hypothetical protein [Rhizobium binae]|uniref:hypothetical protein n=1 Tax=Rhizobium binae TaxID=1138190 RepID=UPI003DA8E12E
MSPAATVPMVADLRSKASRTLTPDARTIGTKGLFFYQASQGELAVVELVSAAAFFSGNSILARQRGQDARIESVAETALATPPFKHCRICGVSLDGSLTGPVDGSLLYPDRARHVCRRFVKPRH